MKDSEDPFPKKLIDDINQGVTIDALTDTDTTFQKWLKNNVYSIKYQENVTPGRYSVYRLVNPFNDEHFYIGYTSDVYSRFRSHMKGPPASNSAQGKARWELISLCGSRGERVKMEIVATFAYRGLAMKLECKLIKEALERGDRIFNVSVSSLNQFLSYHRASI